MNIELLHAVRFWKGLSFTNTMHDGWLNIVA